MPEICRFYGIVIKMFFKPKEHEPSHLHALYGEHIGIFDLKTMKMTEGDLPTRAQQLVQEWMSAHQDRAVQSASGHPSRAGKGVRKAVRGCHA